MKGETPLELQSRGSGKGVPLSSMFPWNSCGCKLSILCLETSGSRILGEPRVGVPRRRKPRKLLPGFQHNLMYTMNMVVEGTSLGDVCHSPQIEESFLAVILVGS